MHRKAGQHTRQYQPYMLFKPLCLINEPCVGIELFIIWDDINGTLEISEDERSDLKRRKNEEL